MNYQYHIKKSEVGKIGLTVKRATRSTEVGEAGNPGGDAASTTVPVEDAGSTTGPVVESDGTWKTSTISTGDEGMSYNGFVQTPVVYS
jgi:hypothetical protein